MKKINYIALELTFVAIIIVFIITTIVIVCSEMKHKNYDINKDSRATLILTNIMENMNSRTYLEFETYIEELSEIGLSKSIEDNMTKIKIDGNLFKGKFFSAEIPEDYALEVDITDADENFNISKKVLVKLIYNTSNNKEEEIELTTIIQREKIEECNAPIISSAYFEREGISQEFYNIIPIKYSNDLKSYVTTTESDDEWYNYSSKEWARVLVFSKEDYNLAELFIDSNGMVKNTVQINDFILNVKNYMYVWIPNFSIEDGESYFRYAASKNSIKMDFLYVENKYLYLNSVAEEVKDISTKCSFDGVFGVWKNIVSDVQDEYMVNFNNTKYAPLNIHI